jgi:hypothetical protein
VRALARTGVPFLLLAAIPAAILILFPAADATGRSTRPKTWTWSFQADTLGREPQHSAVFGGTWEVAVDADSAVAAARPRVLRQADADDGIEFHYLQFKKPVVEDLVASVRFRVLSGEIDPTAGLLFQLDQKKGTSGYLLRVSGEKNRLIAHYILYGKRRDLRSEEIPPLEPGAWHTLSIARKGSVMTAIYDGVVRFQLRDERFRKGTVGLWTEDDTVVEFADLTVSTN